jgi:prepilin-type N-terminal cleavage/methylation domain-containing protein
MRLLGRNPGYTLTELMVGLGLSGIILVIGMNLINSIAQKRVLELALSSNENTLTLLNAEMRKYFERGMAVAFAQDSTVSIPAAIASSRIKVYGAGAFALATDLRSCDEFNPGDSALAANTTYIAFGCCKKAPAILAVQLPAPSGQSVTVTSACTQSPGLSIFRLSATGQVLGSRCDASISALNLLEVGLNQASGGVSYYLQLARDTRQLVQSVASKADSIINRQEFYLTLGNGPNARNVRCREEVSR